MSSFYKLLFFFNPLVVKAHDVPDLVHQKCALRTKNYSSVIVYRYVFGHKIMFKQRRSNLGKTPVIASFSSFLGVAAWARFFSFFLFFFFFSPSHFVPSLFLCNHYSFTKL